MIKENVVTFEISVDLLFSTDSDEALKYSLKDEADNILRNFF